VNVHMTVHIVGSKFIPKKLYRKICEETLWNESCTVYLYFDKDNEELEWSLKNTSDTPWTRQIELFTTGMSFGLDDATLSLFNGLVDFDKVAKRLSEDLSREVEFIVNEDNTREELGVQRSLIDDIRAVKSDKGD